MAEQELVVLKFCLGHLSPWGKHRHAQQISCTNSLTQHLEIIMNLNTFGEDLPVLALRGAAGDIMPRLLQAAFAPS